MLSILCVLRYSITILRNLGLATVLPLDNNLSFHKILGFLILIQAWVHTVMHLLNFGNIKVLINNQLARIIQASISSQTL